MLTRYTFTMRKDLQFCNLEDEEHFQHKSAREKKEKKNKNILNSDDRCLKDNNPVHYNGIKTTYKQITYTQNKCSLSTEMSTVDMIFADQMNT